MRFVLLIVFFVFFVVLGFCIWLFYRIRYLLFKDMVYIGKYMKNNISFNKKNISTLLNEASVNVSVFTRCLIFQNENSIFVKDVDSKLFKEFFDSLGKGDVSWENNNIDFYLNLFEENRQMANDNLHRNGVMYFKLIIGIGIAICIMLI